MQSWNWPWLCKYWSNTTWHGMRLKTYLHTLLSTWKAFYILYKWWDIGKKIFYWHDITIIPPSPTAFETKDMLLRNHQALSIITRCCVRTNARFCVRTNDRYSGLSTRRSSPHFGCCVTGLSLVMCVMPGKDSPEHTFCETLATDKNITNAKLLRYFSGNNPYRAYT